MYSVGCIYERDGDFIFNTAFLVDRAGELAGTYRKIHLYWPEEREGVSPGNELPVFDLDLGRVGIMICYDSWFPETAKLLATITPLQERTWQYQAALHAIPKLNVPKYRFKDTAMKAMGWTLPVAMFSGLGVIAGIALIVIGGGAKGQAATSTPQAGAGA